MESIKDAKNQLETTLDKNVNKMIDSDIRHFSKKLEKVEQNIADIYNKSPDMKCKYDIITSVKGVWNVLVTAILAEIPELGSINRQQASA